MMVERSLASSLFSISSGRAEGFYKKANDNSFSMFSNVLNDAVDRNLNAGKGKKTALSGSTKKENISQKADSSSQTESKKEAVTTKRTNSSKESETLKDNEKKEAIKKYLAENLGINIQDLELLLREFQIDILNFDENLESFNSLKEFLGLDLSEEKALLKLIGMAKEEAGEQGVFITENLEANESRENWIEIQGFQVEVKEDTANTDMEKLSFKIKESLKELSGKDNEDLSEKLYENEEKIMESTKPSIEKAEAEVKKDEVLDAKGYNKYAETKKVISQKNNLDTDEESKMEGHLFHRDDIAPEKKDEDLSQMEFRNLFSENISGVDRLKETAVSQKTEAVPRREIAFQIVEKAKVLLTGDKSEMIMDLKPDHLGKLSLKLVTERGIVVAKFVAENEEVRAAIEANMDTLKESLEKQGFSIQEFSVSVNHNKSRNQDGYRENQKVLTKQEREDRGAITGNVTGRDVEMEILKTNPYQLNGSSINLIA
ncbi:flagellar hook-length control protein FliK [Acetivibrio saccincola]|uniref:Flagellar hook-length control protein-like C-terminal domain-containing protein n=2 Tax=Acetivibrio saccincola TaxID=1677857 RepID=A0A2S8RDJ1_9FIRM|nr:flagellar hook-length control protein FliK [Acetivibrio saccincola]PQQ67864.1 hypothetical protein B9R14_14610 [Acetivibrio saccincola]